jgi:hypothetical protein
MHGKCSSRNYGDLAELQGDPGWHACACFECQDAAVACLAKTVVPTWPAI